MNKYIFKLTIVIILFTGCEDFLDNPPAVGLSNDKLVDIPSMQALIYGAYSQTRGYIAQYSLYSSAMVRDINIRNRAEYEQFYDHLLSTNMTSWVYNSSYSALGLINTVAVSDVDNMEGTDEEKSSILGDMHFLRAMIYFELNNYFTLPSTGYSVPLVKEPIGVNDRVSTTTSENIKNSVEEDIERARQYFDEEPGVGNYYTATALAARIYFYHEKYELAYQRANEVITEGNYIIEDDVADAFVPGKSSRENIFSFVFNSADGIGTSPTQNLFTSYQADDSRGWYSLNLDGELAQFMLADTTDARYSAFFTETEAHTYIDGKYSTDQMDFHYIRLPEMYLIRAEANIRANNSVSQQDVNDINILKERSNPSTVLNSIPSLEEMLNIIFIERTKELAIELGDHFLNVRRLEKPIIEKEEEGGGLKPFNEYNNLLVFPFPESEVEIHGLTRER